MGITTNYRIERGVRLIQTDTPRMQTDTSTNARIEIDPSVKVALRTRMRIHPTNTKKTMQHQKVGETYQTICPAIRNVHPKLAGYCGGLQSTNDPKEVHIPTFMLWV